MEQSDQNELLLAAHRRADRLMETLNLRSADLLASATIPADVRDAGLAALRQAMQCAERFVENAGKSLARRNVSPATPADHLPEADHDE